MASEHRSQGWTGLRVALMATGMLALLGGLWAGLLRLGWAGPLLQAHLPAAHGPLMVCGFLGTVISLERAVALNRAWAFGIPACVGVGGLVTLFGAGGMLGPLLITFGSVGLVAIFGVVLSIQFVPFALVMGSGAVAWAVGNGLWLSGGPVHALVPWYVQYGPEGNLFVDHSQIVQLECLRSGIWGPHDLFGRVHTFKG